MSKWIWLLFTAFLSVALASCSSEDKVDETITIIDRTPKADESAPVAINVILNTVNMRQSPSMNSKVVAKLAANSKIEWLNQVSKVTAPIKLRGVRYNDPWLYVKNSEGVSGWVYAATVNVQSTNLVSAKLKQELLGRRVSTFFGKELADAVNNYRAAYAQAKTSQSFANMYTYGLGLRDKMVQVLANKAQVDPKAVADMSWLDKLLPGYSHDVVAKGTRYYLFVDYKQLRKKAEQTEGDEDNQLVGLFQSIFPEGRESFYPAWMTKGKGNTGISRLGSGVHNAILGKLDGLSKSSQVFMPILTSLKQELVSDMTNPKTSFSEKKNKRLAEVNEILKAGYSVLSSENIAALKAIK